MLKNTGMFHLGKFAVKISNSLKWETMHVFFHLRFTRRPAIYDLRFSVAHEGIFISFVLNHTHDHEFFQSSVKKVPWKISR